MGAAAPPLTGRKVLVVEDDYMIALDMRRSLAELGAEILGPAGRVEEALRLIGGAARIDGAVLDVTLHGAMVFPVADALRERGVPFVFATGYEFSSLPPRFAEVPHFEKPVDPLTIARCLASLG